MKKPAGSGRGGMARGKGVAGRRRSGPNPKSKRRAGVPGSRPADLRRTKAALRRAGVAVARAGAALRAVVGLADSLRERGAEEFRARAAEEMVKEGVLLGLVLASRGASTGERCLSCRGVQAAGDGVLQWAERELGVRPHLEVGQRLEVPVSGLGGFSVSGVVPEGAALVPLEVLAPGWRRGGRVLVPPMVRVVGEGEA